MADFSKQYCELHDMGFEGDFDIWEEFDKLEPEYYVPQICEGFGFIAILKDENGKCLLGMPKDATSNNMYSRAVDWKPYEEIVK